MHSPAVRDREKNALPREGEDTNLQKQELAHYLRRQDQLRLVIEHGQNFEHKLKKLQRFRYQTGIRPQDELT